MKALSNRTTFAVMPLPSAGRHPKRGLAPALFLLGFAPLPFVFAFCSEGRTPPQEEVHLSGRAFGTSYHVTIRGGLKRGDSRNNIQQKLRQLIDKLDASMSNWRPTSTINRLNRSRPYQKIPIEPDFQRVYLHAKLLYKKTKHVFDPGSAALFELWNFRTDTDHQRIHTIPKSRIPSKQKIQRQIRAGGMKNFVLSHGKLYRTNSQAKLNLSALAKGYLVDQMFGMLQKQGYPELLVEVGGEVRVGTSVEASHIGTPIQETNWKIGIEEPRYDRKRNLLFVARLTNQAMATSGDYRNYFRIEKDSSQKIYSHIINPLTGHPKKTALVSATVLGPECMTADALATTLLLLPPKKGLRLLGRFPGYEALLLEKRTATQNQSLQKAQSPPGSREKKMQNETKQKKKSIKKINRHANEHGFAVYMSPGMPAFVEPF